MDGRQFIEGNGSIEHQPLDWVDRFTGIMVILGASLGLVVATIGLILQ